jgi:hypothetical protein
MEYLPNKNDISKTVRYGLNAYITKEKKAEN